MSKVSKEARDKFAEKSKQYKTIIQASMAKENKGCLLVKGSDPKSNFIRLELASINLSLVSYYVLLNNLSVSLLGIKNEAYLNNARKCCYKSIIYLEEIVTNLIDVPFSDYEEGLQSIIKFDDIKRYHLVRKMGFSIQSIKDEYGANSKWKWSFVELEGRFATVAKNLIDLKNMIRKLDPRIEGYPERVNFLEHVKKLLQIAADGYRQKYELSTQRLDDMKLAIQYLCALKRLYSLQGQNQQLEVVKKKIDVWNLKMETDQKKNEKK